MEGISVQEAAEHLHLNEKTVRRRIHLGQIPAIKVPRPQGFEWRVYLDGIPQPVLEAAPHPIHLNTIAEALNTQVDSSPIHLDKQMDTPPIQVDSSPIHLDKQMDTPPIQVDTPPAQMNTQVESSLVQMDTNELLRLVEKLHDENSQLAGQVGFLHAKLQDAQQQIKLLEAPKEPEPARSKTPWWKRLLWS
jgi:excisionase family DNA binding protein